MGEAQYVGYEMSGGVMVATVLREKVTEHENDALLNDIAEAADTRGWRIAMDLSQVGLLSSAGLGGLITLHKRCADAGGRLVVFGLQGPIMDLLKLTKLNRMLTIEPTREAAVKRAAA
jgi:anti-sigma B factor antagonist